MRSRTSRGVPEWSGGKDLYMGSLVLVAGKVSRIIGIVPGVPKGVRRSTKGSTCPGGPHGLWGVRLGLYGPREPAPRGPCAKREGKGRVLKGEGTSEVPWGGRTPPWPHPSLEEGPRLRPPLPCPYIYVGKGRAAIPKPWHLPLPPVTHLPPPAALGEALLESRYFHHHTVVLLDLHQLLLPPCWIKKEETFPLRTCVERGGAFRSALGSSVIWITTSTTPSTPFS